MFSNKRTSEVVNSFLIVIDMNLEELLNQPDVKSN